MVRFDFSGAVRLLSEAKTVAICGHKNPDGDCLGSVLALTLALRSKGVQATPLLATADKPKVYDFLPAYGDLTPSAEYEEKPDVFVMVDVPDEQRIVDGAAVKSRAKATIKIDHHGGPEDIVDCCYIDPTAPAAGCLVWDLLQQLEVEITPDMAQCCYVALMTDTGTFKFQNADESAFLAAASMVAAGAEPAPAAVNVYQRKTLAALQIESRLVQRVRFECDGKLAISWIVPSDLEELGATKDDCEELVNVIRQIDGPEIAVLLRGLPDCIRGSIRAKGDCDVRVIATQMNGGGHKGACGFTLYGDIEDALETVVRISGEYFAGSADKAGCR